MSGCEASPFLSSMATIQSAQWPHSAWLLNCFYQKGCFSLFQAGETKQNQDMEGFFVFKRQRSNGRVFAGSVLFAFGCTAYWCWKPWHELSTRSVHSPCLASGNDGNHIPVSGRQRPLPLEWNDSYEVLCLGGREVKSLWLCPLESDS